MSEYVYLVLGLLALTAAVLYVLAMDEDFHRDPINRKCWVNEPGSDIRCRAKVVEKHWWDDHYTVIYSDNVTSGVHKSKLTPRYGLR